MLSQTSYLARSLLQHGSNGSAVGIPADVVRDLGGVARGDDVDLGYRRDTEELEIYFSDQDRVDGEDLVLFRERAVLPHGEDGLVVRVPADVRRDLGGTAAIDSVDLEYRSEGAALVVRFRQ